MLNNILSNLPKLMGSLGGLFGGNKAATAATANPNDVGQNNNGKPKIPVKPDYFKSDTFSNGTSSIVGDIGGLMSINSSSMNSASKKMATADTAVDTVGSALSFIPGWGAAAGAGLKIVNSIGGNFIGTPEAYKNFSQNSAIAQSSSMGGVAAKATDTAQTIDSYKNSGLAGKLFGKSRGNLNKANKVMDQQRLGQTVLNESDQALMQANTSADMFATKSNMNLMGYNQGNLRFGKEGMRITKKEVLGLKRALKAKQGTKILPKSQPAPMKLLNNDERRHWDGFSDYVNNQGYANHAGLNTGTLSRDLWGDYTTSKNLNLNYDEFVPRLQNTIATFRNQTINKMKNGFGEIKDKDFKNPNFDWDNEYLPGLSNVDGWAGTKTTNFKFPKGAKVNLEKPGTMEDIQRGSTVSAFKDGGSISRESQNIIVDGALHAHKHNLSDNEKFEDAEITEKGVPVITMSEGGEIEQHAEVERDEVIFCLEVTVKLEELMEDGSEEAMIEAGKLLTKELLFNTKDSSSGLLD